MNKTIIKIFIFGLITGLINIGFLSAPAVPKPEQSEITEITLVGHRGSGRCEKSSKTCEVKK